MPSTHSAGHFASLRHETTLNGYSYDDTRSHASSQPFASLRASNHTNGHIHAPIHSPLADEFLWLECTQHDLLHKHGHRHKLFLEKATDFETLKSDDEILVHVIAIGINALDYRGPDYAFAPHSYPWVNGRNFVGVVVRAPRKASRVELGDIVFGAATDYRDVRKAAHHEYIVTSDYNVTRLPAYFNLKNGAAIGVAFVAAAIGLGVSFGLDFNKLATAPDGPDLFHLVRSLDRVQIPEDVRAEVYGSIPAHERPQHGDWIAIWGGSSTTGIFALQLAKLAGLRVISVADVAKDGKRLIDYGADMLVDRFDTERAVEVIRSITNDRLRFAIDVTGRESAAVLQNILRHSQSDLRSHLLAFHGLPKDKVPNVQQHVAPVKIFHSSPTVGESLSVWLEELLIAKDLKMPDVEIINGSPSSIDAALERLRHGVSHSKRIVVPVTEGVRIPTPPPSIPHHPPPVVDEFAYADQLNSHPDRIQFAYWVPNVSGGLVISKIPQRTHWDLKSNKRYARVAERVGFEYALSQIRFMAGYGAENQHEPVTFSQALLHSTERLKLIAALLPGPWNPAVAAKQIASIDNYTDGRIAVNIVSGWFKDEFTSIGQWWLDHGERYRRSREFIECLRGIWTQDAFTYKGDFYRFHDYPLKPKPLALPGRRHPEIFQGGNSHDARENAAAVSDVYFMNGNTLDGFISQIADVRERARRHGRETKVRFALNAFVICRDTEAEAVRVLQEIQGKADYAAVEGFRAQVRNAGASTYDRTGMWAESDFEDLVQYNDGFKTKLIGTKEQIADRILLLKSLGVDILLTAFLHYEEELQQFGDEVLPLVRRLEKQGRGKDREFEIALTGDVYRRK